MKTEEFQNGEYLEQGIGLVKGGNTPFENAKRWLSKIHAKFCF